MCLSYKVLIAKIPQDLGIQAFGLASGMCFMKYSDKPKVVSPVTKRKNFQVIYKPAKNESWIPIWKIKGQCIKVNTIQKPDLNENFIFQMGSLSTSSLHRLLSRS